MKLLNRIYNLLSTRQKKDAFLILFLLIIGLLFEMSSIGIIFPIFDYTLHPEKIKTVQIYFDFKEIITQNIFLKVSMYLLLFLYFVKTIFLYFSINKQNIFASELIKQISQ